MAEKLKILKFPDPRLRTVAKKVEKFDKSLEKLTKDMLHTMYEENGIGLAATQVNRHIRVIVMDLSEERPDKIELKWQDLSGELHQDTPDGLLTICIQHEIDHLEGKLMVDYISPIKRDRIRKKLSK